MKRIIRYYERLKQVKHYEEAQQLYWAVHLDYDLKQSEKKDLISAIQTVESELLNEKWGKLKEDSMKGDY